MAGLVYSFVSRGQTVLAEHSLLAGNFRTVGLQMLAAQQDITDERFTVTSSAYAFNFLRSGNYNFLVVADEAYGRAVPFACLERLCDAFTHKHADKAATVAENGLAASFGPVIKREMEYCMQHPEEVSKMAAVQRKVDAVKSVMAANVAQVLVRDEKVDVLVNKSDDLRDQAAQFQQQGMQLRKRMWWRNARVMALLAGTLVLAIIGIVLLACFAGGSRCSSKRGAAPPAEQPHYKNDIVYRGIPEGDVGLSPGAPNDQLDATLAPADALPLTADEPHFENNITYLGIPEGDVGLSPGDAPAADAGLSPAADAALTAEAPGEDAGLLPPLPPLAGEADAGLTSAAPADEPHYQNNITYLGIPEGDVGLSAGDASTVG